MKFKIRFVYKILPVLIIYGRYTLKDVFTGRSYGFIDIVDPQSNDPMLIEEHELVHSRQVYRTLFLHGIFYWAIDRYRLFAELEAYHTEIKKRGNTTDVKTSIANRLHKNYNLKYSFTEIYNYTKQYYNSH